MTDEDEGIILRGAPAPLLCQPGEVCVGGTCQPEEPVVPPSDEAEPGGQPGGCGCATDGGASGALGGLLLALGAMLVATRKRRRR
jgi:MYXO-CTERM domain-containing protein